MAWKRMVKRRTAAAQGFIAKHPKTYPLIKHRAWEIAWERYNGVLAKAHLLQALDELLDERD